MLQEVRKQHSADVSDNSLARSRLAEAAEKAKHTLSVSNRATVEVEDVCDGIELDTTITRARFEHLCADLFERSMLPVEECLQDAELGPEDIDEVVLVGGSTRIPRIQSLLRQHLNGKELNKSVNPDEAVAYGAAIQAAMLTQRYNPRLQRLTLQDVTPLSLGIRVFPGVVSVIVPRNTPIPTRMSSDKYSNLHRHCETVEFSVHEGEGLLATPKSRICSFELSGLPTGPTGSQTYEVTFEIDENSMLTVKGMHQGTRRWEEVTLDYSSSRLSDDEVQEMRMRAEAFDQTDRAAARRQEAKNALTQYAYGIQRALEAGLADVIPEDGVHALRATAQLVIERLSTEGSLQDVQEYHAMKEELEGLTGALLQRSKNRAFPDVMGGAVVGGPDES